VASPLKSPPPDQSAAADQRLVTRGVPWSQYEAQLALRGDKAVPRIAYLEGALELMSPSKDHERIKGYLGRLIEAYALARDVRLSPYGSWTLKNAPGQVGLEPDECYIVGADQGKAAPDLAVEVILTSGGLDKLEIYRRLGIREVWLWQVGRLEVHVLEDGRYGRVERSAIFPGLDLDLVAALLDQPTALDAVLALQARLRETP
jgi:Uma2 family endonuclease